MWPTIQSLEMFRFFWQKISHSLSSQLRCCLVWSGFKFSKDFKNVSHFSCGLWNSNIFKATVGLYSVLQTIKPTLNWYREMLDVVLSTFISWDGMKICLFPAEWSTPCIQINADYGYMEICQCLLSEGQNKDTILKILKMWNIEAAKDDIKEWKTASTTAGHFSRCHAQVVFNQKYIFFSIHTKFLSLFWN